MKRASMSGLRGEAAEIGRQATPASEAERGSWVPGAALRAGGVDAAYVERAAALILLLVLAIGCILVLKPFITGLLWALIVVVSTWPLFLRLEQLTGRTDIAATVMTLAVAVVLMLPIITLGMKLSENAVAGTQFARDALAGGLPPLPDWLANMPIVGSRLRDFWAKAAHDNAALSAALQPYIGVARDWLLARGGDLLDGFVQLTVGLFVAFFLYRDGRAVAGTLQNLIARMSGHRAERLLDAARNTVIGVVQGVLGTSLAQAILTGTAFYVAGIPASLLVGFVAFFLSLIPLGLALIWLPAIVWLSSNHETGWAVFMLAAGFFVATLDNWLRPLLIMKTGELPLALILLGVFGGAVVFGFLGLVLGPVLLALGYTLVREWGGEAAAPRA